MCPHWLLFSIGSNGAICPQVSSVLSMVSQDQAKDGAGKGTWVHLWRRPATFREMWVSWQAVTLVSGRGEQIVDEGRGLCTMFDRWTLTGTSVTVLTGEGGLQPRVTICSGPHNHSKNSTFAERSSSVCWKSLYFITEIPANPSARGTFY